MPLLFFACRQGNPNSVFSFSLLALLSFYVQLWHCFLFHPFLFPPWIMVLSLAISVMVSSRVVCCGVSASSIVLRDSSILHLYALRLASSSVGLNRRRVRTTDTEKKTQDTENRILEGESKSKKERNAPSTHFRD